MESAAASGAGSAGTECDGEDQEDSSSSHSDEGLETSEILEKLSLKDNPEIKDKRDNEDELAAFRQQWQRELEGTPSPQREAPKRKSPSPKPEVQEPQTDEERAKQLFLRGVELERSSKLYEAVQHYKRAMQILPDVEARLYDASDVRAETPEAESEAEEVAGGQQAVSSDDEDAVEGEELLARLQRITARRGCLCEPAYQPKGAHISWLPYEVVLLVLRWVVGAELDAGSLERVAATCRGLYVAAREPDIWRSLCVKTWGIDCGTPRASGCASWRQMFVQRPRLQLHGCYISKTTYLRHGEAAFQDHSYRPWYLIEYYRYLRFFPDGVVLMWTTPDEPASCVGLLQRGARPQLGIMPGHYRLIGDKVVVVVKKPIEKKLTQTGNIRYRGRRKDAAESYEHTFHIELQLRGVRSRRNWQLAWLQYSVSVHRDQWTEFELASGKFPPFAFSQVRAYTATAHAPLAHTHAYC